MIRELLVGSIGEDSGGPHLRRQEAVSLGQGSENCHGEIASGSGVSRGRRVHVLDTGHVQQLLGDEGRDDTGSSGGRDQTNAD